MHVGDHVQNLAQVKQGDSVLVRYHGSVAFILTPRGAQTPRTAAYGAAARAAPGQLPAGELAGKLVVTSTVVGVDPASHPCNWSTRPGGKVGDTITAVISQTLALAVEPVT